MDFHHHNLPSLFAQLGLPVGDAAIEQFIARHRPLPAGMPLAEAPFWTPAQAAFLRDEWLEDGDWAEVVDELNLRLHS
ncbi:MAG: DUF2789 domain-containing protein [Azonexus sp.]